MPQQSQLGTGDLGFLEISRSVVHAGSPKNPESKVSKVLWEQQVLQWP